MTKAAKKTATAQAAPIQPPEPGADRPVVRSALTNIDHCRALPLADADANFDPVEFESRTIQRFADRDGATMVVVAVDGSLHKSPAPPKEQDDGQA